MIDAEQTVTVHNSVFAMMMLNAQFRRRCNYIADTTLQCNVHNAVYENVIYTAQNIQCEKLCNYSIPAFVLHPFINVKKLQIQVCNEKEALQRYLKHSVEKFSNTAAESA